MQTNLPDLSPMIPMLRNSIFFPLVNFTQSILTTTTTTTSSRIIEEGQVVLQWQQVKRDLQFQHMPSKNKTKQTPLVLYEIRNGYYFSLAKNNFGKGQPKHEI